MGACVSLESFQDDARQASKGGAHTDLDESANGDESKGGVNPAHATFPPTSPRPGSPTPLTPPRTPSHNKSPMPITPPRTPSHRWNPNLLTPPRTPTNRSSGFFGDGRAELQPPLLNMPETGLRIFTERELSEATQNFSDKTVLGEGGFGKVYHGKMRDNDGDLVSVAVKNLSPEAVQGTHEWLTEIVFLGRLLHPNLVRLLGYCKEGEGSLVYEYVPLRSLDYHLFTKDPEKIPILHWEERLSIAVGAARGLAFLHQNDVIHRDFKAANILLTEDYDAKLADFGLAKDSGGKTHVSTAIMGTLGYLDPCYAQTGQLTKRSDVYAYGVVLLELITGRKAMGLGEDGRPISLAKWAQPFIENRRQDVNVILDKKLPQPFPRSVARVIATSARYCLQLDPKVRPDMQVMVDNLEPLLKSRALRIRSSREERKEGWEGDR